MVKSHRIGAKRTAGPSNKSQAWHKFKQVNWEVGLEAKLWINVLCPTALMVSETQGGDPGGEDAKRSGEFTSTRLTHVKPADDGTKWRIPTCNRKLNFATLTLSWLSLNRLARIDCGE